MASRTQIQYNSIVKEIEKYQKSLERYEGILAKKIAQCEKLGCNWTDDEWFKIRDAKAYTAEQDIAHFKKVVAEGDVKDTQHRLANAQSRLAKAAEKIEAEQSGHKDDSMNEHKAEIERLIKQEVTELIGGYENTLNDFPEDSEEYKYAKDILNHDDLFAMIYWGVMKESQGNYKSHIRFAGKQFIEERIEWHLAKNGYGKN